jgi:hypothetical protein
MRDLFIDASFAFPEVDRHPSEPCNYLKILQNLPSASVGGLYHARICPINNNCSNFQKKFSPMAHAVGE